ncbi:MAG: glycosyltransferase [Candidatus Jordarchaeaceae archaeon]
MEHNKLPTLSVIIPTFGFRYELADCLEALLSQYTNQALGEILICHQGPFYENCVKIVEKISQKYNSKLVNIIRVPGPSSLTFTRNYAARIAKFPILLFLDDDAIIEKNFITEIAKFYSYCKDAGAVGGNVLSIDKRTLYTPYIVVAKIFGFTRPTENRFDILLTTENTFAYPFTRCVEAGWLSGCAFSVPVDKYIRIKSDEKLKRYSFKEDIDFSLRLKRYLRKENLKMYVIPTAKVRHLQAKGSRMTGFPLYLMKESYTWYIFYKDIYFVAASFKGKISSLAFFLWSRVGKMALKTAEALCERNPSIILYYTKSFIAVLYNLRKILSLNISFVDYQL